MKLLLGFILLLTACTKNIRPLDESKQFASQHCLLEARQENKEECGDTFTPFERALEFRSHQEELIKHIELLLGVLDQSKNHQEAQELLVLFSEAAIEVFTLQIEEALKEKDDYHVWTGVKLFHYFKDRVAGHVTIPPEIVQYIEKSPKVLAAAARAEKKILDESHNNDFIMMSGTYAPSQSSRSRPVTFCYHKDGLMSLNDISNNVNVSQECVPIESPTTEAPKQRGNFFNGFRGTLGADCQNDKDLCKSHYLKNE